MGLARIIKGRRVRLMTAFIVRIISSKLKTLRVVSKDDYGKIEGSSEKRKAADEEVLIDIQVTQ
jgi:hypothetical protein